MIFLMVYKMNTNKKKWLVKFFVLASAILMATPLMVPLQKSVGSSQNETNIASSTQFSVSITGKSSYVSQNMTSLEHSLLRIFSQGKPYMVIINGTQSQRLSFLNAWNNALKNSGYSDQQVNPGIINKVSENRQVAENTSNPFFTSSAIAISYKPFGYIVGHGITDSAGMAQFIAFANQTFSYEISHGSGVVQTVHNSKSTDISTDSSPSLNYFTGIGYRGVFYEYANESSIFGTYEAGWIGVAYYFNEYTYTAPDGTTYYEFGVIARLNIEGYSYWWAGSHPPGVLYEATEWHTNTYAGQVLYDWNPENTGTYQSGSTGYTVSAAYGPASISISWTSSNSISWADTTNLPNGNASVAYTFSGASTGQLYTLWPGSTAFLDPNKAGGVLPMDVTEMFYGGFIVGRAGYYYTPTFQAPYSLSTTSVSG